MLPQMKEDSCYQQYSIVKTFTKIEGKSIIQYGIEQISYDSNGRLIKTIINDISENKVIVNSLLEKIEKEDVQDFALQDIVEDYIAELSTI